LYQNHIINELKQNSKQFGIGKHKFFKGTKVIKNVVIHQVYSPSSSMSFKKKLEQLLMIQNKKNSKVHSKFSCHKTNSNYPFFYPNQSNLILSYSDITILPILSYSDSTSFPLTRTPHTLDFVFKILSTTKYKIAMPKNNYKIILTILNELVVRLV